MQNISWARFQDHRFFFPIRKFAASWRLTYHKRKLTRLHQEVLRPVRENRLLRVMFNHWISSMESRHLEAERADEMRERLQKTRLHACFLLWQGETNKVLLVKPLQQRREQRKLTESLNAWRSYVARKSQSRANHELFKKKVMKSTFESWRRQYQASQIAKQIAAHASQGLLLCHLEAWKFIIERKRKSREFRKCKLVKSMFLSWRGRASFEMDRRARLEEEQASNQRLKERCFYLWRENSRVRADATERYVESFLQRRCQITIGAIFLDWRRHLHSTLVSRAYNKSLGDRLLATLFSEWREVTSCITQNAVRAFSERIGLRDHVTEVSSTESGIGVMECSGEL
ncbi:hypothetical protein ElyMa_005263900 [Elysia marginata]|uniref:Sfi1 spindle body domain-containing protein n=1 Tax=Elysia marginata TaxID=1093978 RepID=A0AAV4JZA1_9GAST|nr:hypothetical protein ElyMa_005263900 [Elysia marginata]